MIFKGLTFVVSTVGVLAMLFYTPVIFSKTIFNLEYGDCLSAKEKRTIMIPVWNVVQAEKLYRGSSSSIGICNIVFVCAIVFRLVCFTMFRSVGILTLVSVILLLASFFSILLANGIFVFSVLYDAKVNTLSSCVLLSVVFPLGQYYVGTFMNTVIKNMNKEEEVF